MEKLDAYGHLNWTVGNEDWIACFDARRVQAGIEYHVVVDCESGGFTDTIESGTVEATEEGVRYLKGLPGHFADICCENYLDTDPEREYGEVEWQDTDKRWGEYVDALLKEEPPPDNTVDEEGYSEEQTLDYFNRYIAGDR